MRFLAVMRREARGRLELQRNTSEGLGWGWGRGEIMYIMCQLFKGGESVVLITSLACPEVQKASRKVGRASDFQP